MRYFVAFLLFVAVSLFFGCGKSAPPAGGKGKAQPLKIVATIFPEYDWTREILGSHLSEVELTLLLDSGLDLHNYEPTAQDLLKVGGCDLFLYVGGESDKWVDSALASVPNAKRRAVNLLQALGDQVREEEHVEGMEEHHHHDDDDDDDADDHAHHHHDDYDDADDHAHHHHDDDDDEVEWDEHVWLSLRLAQRACAVITEELATLDPANAADYRANCAAYTAKLAALDAQFQEAVRAASVKTLLFGDRFPFRYLTEDYGLEYFAAFSGCSAEAEASFKTILFLAEKVKELDLPCVLAIEGLQHRLAETIVKTAGRTAACPVLVLDSLQGTTLHEVNEGKTYLDTMRWNLEILRKALNR